MTNPALTIAGIALTSVFFISLFGMVALIMDSAMAHTDAMLVGIKAYTESPTEDNRAELEKSIDSSSLYIRDISGISSSYLRKYLDTVDSGILSEAEKDSLIEAKKMLDRIEEKDPKDPDALKLKQSLESILDRLGESS